MLVAEVGGGGSDPQVDMELCVSTERCEKQGRGKKDFFHVVGFVNFALQSKPAEPDRAILINQ